MTDVNFDEHFKNANTNKLNFSELIGELSTLENIIDSTARVVNKDRRNEWLYYARCLDTIIYRLRCIKDLHIPEVESILNNVE